MNKTKRTLVLTGSILALVLSVIFVFSGVMCIYISHNFITERNAIEALKLDKEYTFYQLEGNDYYFEFEEDGQLLKITKEDIQVTVEFLIEAFKTIAIGILVFAVVYFILSLLTIIQSAKNKSGNKKVIALLVLSALSINIATTVLLAIALSYKDKKPTLENINDFVIEN